ncbi:MAG: pyridoxamine 5'-phosphate oxidase family protein [Deltaproteobacteria bacterium]|nr:pyridoxamine 5'-phosphate oxidase family protein [Deltaproteobacteria bacterium]
MGKLHEKLDKKMIEFIEAQKLFFVTTAPTNGRLSLSPKGLDTLRVLGENKIAYLDLTGSSSETAAHLRENGRITIMFCAFEGSPLVLRTYGTGRVIRRSDPEWESTYKLFNPLTGARHIFIIEISSVQTSCGYGVPIYNYEGERPELSKWLEDKGEDGVKEYWKKKNTESIDGIPTKIFGDEE